MSNDLSTQVNPATMLQAAIDRGMDVQQLGSLMALYERWQENQARIAFNHAVNDFKQNPPDVFKTKLVEFGKTKFTQSELDKVVDAVTPALCSHGLTVRWSTAQDDSGQIIVTCILTHLDGHSESFTMRGPADTTGSKSPVQAIVSTSTLLQRHTLLGLLGMAAKGAPDAGHEVHERMADSSSNLISDDQVMTIEAFITDHDLPRKPVMQYLESKGHKAFADLPAKSFDGFMQTLKRSAERHSHDNAG